MPSMISVLPAFGGAFADRATRDRFEADRAVAAERTHRDGLGDREAARATARLESLHDADPISGVVVLGEADAEPRERVRELGAGHGFYHLVFGVAQGSTQGGAEARQCIRHVVEPETGRRRSDRPARGAT